jgi:hypothetical protein
MYGVMGLTYVLAYMVGGGNKLVTDAAGVVWQTASISEARAAVSIYTMIFVAALSAVKLLQGSGGATRRSAYLPATTAQFEPKAVEVS